MKKIILFFGYDTPLKFPYGVNKYLPWISGVNSVIVDKVDPFYTKLMVPSFEEILNHRCNKDFETLCFERAEEIRKLNLPIYIQYSGGTDSTCVLLSILRSWSKEDLNRVNILMTEDSIDEFPEFWPEIKNTFNGRIFDAREYYNFFHKNGYVITGEGGDQLFGSVVVQYFIEKYSEEIIHSDWKTPFFNNFIYNFNGNKEECSVFLKKYIKTFNKCPFQLKTVFDVAWWWNYTNKLQYVAYRGLLVDNTILKTYEKRNISFYITKDFLRWSLDNHDKKIKNTYLTYKWVAKNFIQKYTGIEEHWYVPKIPSLKSLWSYKKNKNHFEYAKKISNLKNINSINNLAIDENFNYLTINEISRSIRQN